MTIVESGLDTNDHGHPIDQPGEGHPVGWYPVALSESLRARDLLGLDLFDGRIVVYRGDDLSVNAMSPFCKHMGSDLSVGEVVGNELRCAFHHWHYGRDGRCTKIPSGDRIPSSARLHTFPTEEKWGIIWVWWGPQEPLYPVPTFLDWDDTEWVYRTFEVPLTEKLFVDPWVFVANGFDFQHFRVVHDIQDLNPEVQWEDYSATWTHVLNQEVIGEVTMTFQYWGLNTLVSRAIRGDETLAQVAGTSPMGPLGLRFFMALATQRGPKAEEILDEQEALHAQLISEDFPIMRTLRDGILHADHLVASDRQLARFFRWFRAYPKATMADMETTSS